MKLSDEQRAAALAELRARGWRVEGAYAHDPVESKHAYRVDSDYWLNEALARARRDAA